MLFDIQSISTFAPWPDGLPLREGRAFSELVIEESNGDLLCELVIWGPSESESATVSTRLASCPILISTPVAYAVTLGDVMSQQIISLERSSSNAPGMVLEAPDSLYVKALREAEPGVETVIVGDLQHFIIPSNDRWIHAIMDGVPHIGPVQTGQPRETENNREMCK